jgi:hypothetical protein
MSSGAGRFKAACFAAQEGKKYFSSRETVLTVGETFLAIARKQAAQVRS